ncbi:MAG: hypothetical protein HC831_21645 [Chloroflexia bacterium]|nr:hypothetical protein [Chloroflexia bacterium]
MSDLDKLASHWKNSALLLNKYNDISFDKDGLAWVDSYIEHTRNDKECEGITLPLEKRIFIWGAWFGEYIIKNFRGEWVEPKGMYKGFGVQLYSGGTPVGITYPFWKVQKRFEFGKQDSLIGMDAMLQSIINHPDILEILSEA